MSALPHKPVTPIDFWAHLINAIGLVPMRSARDCLGREFVMMEGKPRPDAGRVPNGVLTIAIPVPDPQELRR